MGRHSAGGPLGGYLWQLRKALLELLGRDYGQAITIEKDDDICIVRLTGELVCSIQAKHSLDASTLTTHSVELWKTLRVWAHQLASTQGNYRRTLATTSKLDAVVAALDAGAPGDSVARAALMQALNKVAASKPNQDLIACYAAWESLTAHQREELLQSASIVAASPHLAELSHDLERAVRRHHIRQTDQTRVAQGVEGWFLQTVSARLTSGGCTIAYDEVWDVIEEEHRKYFAAAPPAEPTTHAADLQAAAASLRKDGATFLRQLTFLDANDQTLERAALFYSRARVARERWLEDAAITRTQITSYANELVDHWSTVSGIAQRGLSNDPDDRTAAGWKIHDDCMGHTAPFGPSAAPTYLTSGSYHMLADEPCLGWHPDYNSLLGASSEQ